MLFDVVADHKHVYAALLIGNLENNTTSSAGNECMKRLAEYQEKHSNNNAVMLVDVRQKSKAQQIVKKNLKLATEGTALLFCCTSELAYQGVAESLNIQSPSNYWEKIH